MEHPDQWERWRAERPSTAIDEILRFASPAVVLQRTATEDTEVGGQTIHRGARVGMYFASANFDEDVYTDPRRFDIGRTPNPHVTFGGGGQHYCIGANLTKLEVRIMFDALADALPDIKRRGRPMPAPFFVAQRHQGPARGLWGRDNVVTPEPVVSTAWTATRLGAATEALEIRTVEVGPPGPNQVRVAVETFSLDFNDLDTIHGRYGLLKFEPPFVPGMVAAGVVDATGTGAEALIGRRVIGVTVGVQGGYASSALLDAATVQTLPSWLSFVDATAMYFPYLLGWLALRERGRLRAGEIVLVHAAAGGVGSGVVQLAKAFGAVVIATAGTEEKVDFCRQLGADHAVNYRTEDFVEYVDDVTNGRGVDLAFDSVGGQVTKDTFRTMAFNGRHLIVGLRGRHRLGGRAGEPAAGHLRQLRPRWHLLCLRRRSTPDPQPGHELLVACRWHSDVGGDPPNDDGQADPTGGRTGDRLRGCPTLSRDDRAPRDCGQDHRRRAR